MEFPESHSQKSNHHPKMIPLRDGFLDISQVVCPLPQVSEMGLSGFVRNAKVYYHTLAHYFPKSTTSVILTKYYREVSLIHVFDLTTVYSLLVIALKAHFYLVDGQVFLSFVVAKSLILFIALRSY